MTLPERKFIRKPQIEAVLKHLDRGKHPKRDRMLVLLAASLGLRVTEVVSLRKLAFRDLLKGWVWVRSAKKRDGGKRPEERLPVPPGILPELKAYLRGKGWKEFLFPGRANGHMSERYAFQLFSDACKACGFGHKSFHALRHYRGFTVQEAKGDLDWTRRMMRHESVATTQIYTERTPDEEQQLAKEIGW